MASLYASLEQVKRIGSIKASDQDEAVIRLIESSSDMIDKATRRWFIPQTKTNELRWPNELGIGTRLWMREDLLVVNTLQTKAQDSSPTTIASSDFFLEPQDLGPPFSRIEINLSTNAAFESGDTPQRSISVAGRWGFSEDTLSTGTVVSGLSSDPTVTTMVCSNASLIGVGSSLLIESEQVYVSAREYAALGSVLINDANVTASMDNVTITLDASHGVLPNEVIRLDSEEMFVVGVSTNDLTVIRQYNGSVLAAHANDTAVHTNRTLTIERGVNGTTAATHADSTAISKYEPPFNINQLCIDQTLFSFAGEQSHMGRTVGTGEGAQEVTGKDLATEWAAVKGFYMRRRSATI